MSVKRAASPTACIPDEDSDAILLQPQKKRLQIDVSGASTDATAYKIASQALSQIAEMTATTSTRSLSSTETDSLISTALPSIGPVEDSSTPQGSAGGSTVPQGQGYQPCRKESPSSPVSSSHGRNFPTIQFSNSPQLSIFLSPHAMPTAPKSTPTQTAPPGRPRALLEAALKKIIKVGHPQTVYKATSVFNTENIQEYRNFLFPPDPNDEPLAILLTKSGNPYFDCTRELASPQINSNPEKDLDRFGWSQVNAFGRQFRGIHVFTLGYFDCYKCMIEGNRSKAFMVKAFNIKPGRQLSPNQMMAYVDEWIDPRPVNSLPRNLPCPENPSLALLRLLIPRGYKWDGFEQMDRLDECVDCLLLRYEKTLSFGLRVPIIHNRDRIKKDGCIIEEYADPIGPDVPWRNKDALSPQEEERLESFCNVLEVAIRNWNQMRWNLAPENFVILPDETLALSNLTELPFEASWDQWGEFHKAITGWTGNNPAAKTVVVEKLQQIGGSNLTSWSPQMVNLTIRLLSEEASANPIQLESFGSEVPWKDKDALSDEEQLFLLSFCKCLKTAFGNVNQRFWDLDPKHFKKTSIGTVELSRLIEFSPNEEDSLEISKWDQWEAFQKAISKWVGGNDRARTIVALELDKVAEDCFNHNEKIIGLKNKLVEGYMKMPWAETNTLSSQEKILLSSFCENLVSSVLKIAKSDCVKVAGSPDLSEIPWDNLQDKINRWATNNHEARTVLISELLETEDVYDLASLSGPILYSGTRLLEGYANIPWAGKARLSASEKKLFGSFCSILEEIIKDCRKGEQNDWEGLYTIITKWVKGNSEANEIVIANLENIIEDDDDAPDLVNLKNRLENSLAPN